jgi:hypothetical protein
VAHWAGYEGRASLQAECTLATLISLQLLLPSQDARFVGFGLGFGDHAFFLVENGEAGVGENVVGIERGDLIGHFDGLVEAVEVLEGAA